MARTDKFRLQHNELMALANELQGMLNEDALSQDAAAARRCLGNLMGKLTMHLSTEDKVLYPELEANKDPAVASLAHRFASEMKTTAASITAYNGRWGTPSAIKANAHAFIKETKDVIKILADRIKRENQELYATADRSEGKAF
ncbi:MAG TPA: hemerythrin domain-containing protein [Noviherbaspirillum sp.]|uniref:hemerythrin domain-containing protein n=1 Tax=Oxalobacteraceae TaxID=75682 RepID=UPI0010A4BF53|nr:hemerythrin domain-containing protein [Herbaspirillum sp. ST 5-3]HJV51849.1 hemerythrin domain-containing protein [Noviherbaspirillum sp.]